ncbi:hypothetical protein BHK69_07245 [Bosea vaviloviae]|uniref:Uncharacterized protein n=1 Tax=Bosea vaviloviae TaxID=1526658 RepID=A0A1D7TYT8_9HYPH|nr:hypothetical protein BHK69_07245 [Bosea vaviloviae]
MVMIMLAKTMPTMSITTIRMASKTMRQQCRPGPSMTTRPAAMTMLRRLPRLPNSMRTTTLLAGMTTTLMTTRLMAMRPYKLPWMSVVAAMTMLRRLPSLPNSMLMTTPLTAMRPCKLPWMSVVVVMTMLRRLRRLPNSMRMTIPLAGMITDMITTATITRMPMPMPTPLQTGLPRSSRPMR